MNGCLRYIYVMLATYVIQSTNLLFFIEDFVSFSDHKSHDQGNKTGELRPSCQDQVNVIPQLRAVEIKECRGVYSLTAREGGDCPICLSIAEYRHVVARLCDRARGINVLAPTPDSGMEGIIGLLAVVIFGDFTDGAHLATIDALWRDTDEATWKPLRIWRDEVALLSEGVADDMGIAGADRQALCAILHEMFSQWRGIAMRTGGRLPSSGDATRGYFVARWRDIRAGKAAISALESTRTLHDLDERLRNILSGAGIETLDQLRILPTAQLRLIPGIGRERLKALDHFLKDRRHARPTAADAQMQASNAPSAGYEAISIC